MAKHLLFFSSLILLSFSVAPEKLHAQNAPSVAINEVMASNSVTVADEDGDYPDWIELFNTSNSPINLGGYGLSDNYEDPFKWIFPEVFIEPGEFLLVWASRKDRRTPGQPLHTNYAISAAGEEIILTSPDGTLLDSLPPTPIPIDVSLGRQPDGTGEWFFFEEPTPGAPNSTETIQGQLDPPVFSQESGFYSSSISLSISHPDPTAQILYTIDGSEPSESAFEGIPYRYRTSYAQNPGDTPGNLVTLTTRTQRYGAPLIIQNRSSEPNVISQIPGNWNTDPFYLPRSPVLKGTVVRAKAVKPGFSDSEVITQTYFVFPGGRNLFTLPVASVTVNPSGLFDVEEGIYVPGIDFETWRAENPDQRAEALSPANYHRRGEEAEREAHFTFFGRGNDRIDLEQNIGVRIHGFTGRIYPQKTLRLYARGSYGDSNFDFPFFGETGPNRHRRLLLRNSGQDYNSTFLRDAVAQTLVRHMRFDTQLYQPLVLFINGEYWGIHNLRERYDRHYLELEYGVNPDNIDLMETNGVVIEGDGDHYFNMNQYIDQNDLADEEHYLEVTRRMDPDNFMDYQIAQLFLQNYDWPGSNLRYWRAKTDAYEPGRPYGQDGRWRWLMFDMDRVMTLYENVDPDWRFNTLYFATADDGPDFPNPPWSTFLLRNLLKNEGFRKAFINRYADQLNTAFSTERFVSLINELSLAIRPEINRHQERWMFIINNWDSELNRLNEFASNRTDQTFQHILDFFELQNTHSLTLLSVNNPAGGVKVNTIELADSTPGFRLNGSSWTGTYFEGVPVQLSPLPSEGWQFSHWLVNGDRFNSATLSLDLTDDTIVEPVFEEAQLTSVDGLDLVHFFLFDDSLPNNTPLSGIASSFSLNEPASISFRSALDGYPFDPSHPNWRAASMERRNSPTGINYRPEANDNLPYEEAENLRAIQIRQPFEADGRENSLMFHLPTTGFDSAVLSFAAMNENAGVNGLFIDYSFRFSVNSQTADTTFFWTTDGLAEQDLYKSLTNGIYQLYTVDFSDISTVSNNSDFRVRLRFDAPNSTLAQGDRVTFNNVSLDGNPVPFLPGPQTELFLGQNYPNPFTSLTTIPFTLAETGHVRLEVFTTLGQRVALLRDEQMQAGDHRVFFDTGQLSSGIYIYRIQTQNYMLNRSMVLIR